MKTPGGRKIQAAGRSITPVLNSVTDPLEHPKYDRADKSEYHVSGNNAQSADERTREGHWGYSLWFHVSARSHKTSKPFRPEKVSDAVARAIASAGNVVKDS
jgi:hypothetical protein